MLRKIAASLLILLLSSCVQTPPRTWDLPSGVKAIGGEKSPPRFGKILNALQLCLTRAERVTISNASHQMPRQNPKAFSDAVATFISKH